MTASSDESPAEPGPSVGVGPEPGEGREGAQVVRRAGVVAGFTLASRVLGYVRDATLSNLFGASVEYDAFIVAQTIPNFLRRLVAEGSLVIAFVPLLAEARQKGGHAEMRRFSAAVLGLLIPVLVALTLVGVLFPGTVVSAFAPGFDPNRFAVAESLTRIMMGYIFFISLVAVAGGALNVEGVFAPTAAAPILLNISIVSLAVFGRHYFAEPIEAVGWGVLLGGALQLVLQIPYLRRVGLLVWPSLDWANPALLTLLRRMGPAVFGVAVYQINIMVIRQIGSFLPTGQLSCYYNATRLQEFALGVFAVSVSVAALPTMSEHAASGDWARLRGTFRRALRVTNFVTIPAMFGLAAVSGPIVGVLFRHGQFTTDNARMTAELLVLLALALVPVGAVRVTVPAFYALGDTKTPVLAASLSLLTTFGLGHLLRDSLEIHGLVIATTAAAAAQAVVLWGLFRRALVRRTPAHQLPKTTGPTIWGHAALCALASLPGSAAAYWLAGSRDWYAGGNWLGALFLLPLIGLVSLSYALLAKRLGVDEVDLVLGAVRRRLGRRTKA